MYREEDRVHEIMKGIADGEDVGEKLVWDPVKKRITSASAAHDPDRSIELTPKDMEHFSVAGGSML